MKYWQTAVAILAALFASLAFAEDFKTINGKEYKDATVTRVEPDGLVLKTKSGISKIYFTELGKDVQERFGYDSAKAAQFNAAQRAAMVGPNAAASVARPNATASVGRQQTIPAARDENLHTIMEVESDQPNFLGRPFVLQGRIQISDYYNWGYGSAEKTHYSFRITDRSRKSCNVYATREGSAGLRQVLLDAGGAANGTFGVILLSNRYHNSGGRPGELLLELINYRLEQSNGGE